MRTRYVLSIDGGGVRGIVAAVMLDAFEGELRKAGYKDSLAKCFDVIVGTSTGSIIAAAIALSNENGDGPLRSPSQLRDLYRREAATIFPKRFLTTIPVLRSLRQLIAPLYSPQAFEKILHDEFGEADFIKPKRNLLITAYSLEPRDAVFFRGGPLTPPGDPLCSGAIKIADAVMGSAAAPTFFPPHQITDPHTKKRQSVIDGGIFINDPSVAGFAEALRLFPDDDIRIISLGTGRIVQSIPHGTSRRWGFYQWISPTGPFRTPLLSAISDGQARAVYFQLKKLIGERYQRFDYDLNRGYGTPSLDDGRTSNMKNLERGALKMVEEMRPRIRESAIQLLADKNRDQRGDRV